MARNGGIDVLNLTLSLARDFANNLITSHIRRHDLRLQDIGVHIYAGACAIGRSKLVNAIEIAVSRFKEGFICSESVLMGYAESNGIADEVIPRIATGFAGGIGRRGSICGALVGAIMALGMKYGRDRIGDSHAYELCVAKSSECYGMFERSFGSASCFDLTACDLSTPEGRRIYRESGLRDKKCTRYVEEAARILSTLI